MRYLAQAVKRPAFWLVSVTLLFLTILHYREATGYPQLLADVMSAMGITRHSFERILYLAPDSLVRLSVRPGWGADYICGGAALHVAPGADGL